MMRRVLRDFRDLGAITEVCRVPKQIWKKGAHEMRRFAIVLSCILGFAGSALAGDVTYVLDTPGVV